MEDVWNIIKRNVSQLTNFQKRNKVKKLGLPLLLVILLGFIKNFAHPILGDNSAFLLTSFIVAVSAWYGGFSAGIFATIILLPTIYILYLSTDKANHPFIGDVVLLIIFSIEGFAISVFSKAKYEIERQKSDFISFVAHELKNPLAAIKGFAQLITHYSRNKKFEKVEKLSTDINSQSDRIMNLLKKIINFVINFYGY